LGLSRLPAFLRHHSRIAIDTNIFIYQLEENLRYLALTDSIFSWLSRRAFSGISSTLTMTELLVQPLRRGDSAGASLFYSLLTAYPNLHWIAPDLDIAQLAAQLRANYRLKTTDALIAATAMHASATGLITNDAALSRVEGLDVLVLETLL
jgi:predicted nucleic acid-binding protein